MVCSLLSFQPMFCNTTSPPVCGKLSENMHTHLQLHSFFQQVTSTSREQQDMRQRVPIQQHPRRPTVNMVRAGNVVRVPKHKANGRSPVTSLGNQRQSWDKLPTPIQPERVNAAATPCWNRTRGKRLHHFPVRLENRPAVFSSSRRLFILGQIQQRAVPPALLSSLW